MSTDTRDITVYLCQDHLEYDLKKSWPRHKFNDYICYPPKTCTVVNCGKSAYYQFTGVVVPDIAPLDIHKFYSTQPSYEIFEEAREVMVGKNSVEALCRYLDTRIIPRETRGFLAKKLIRHYATLILQKLNISKRSQLSDLDKHKILIEIGVYPVDMWHDKTK